MADTDPAGAADETAETAETEARWYLEPYDADIDDAPKGDADDCNGDGDPAEGDDDGAP